MNKILSHILSCITMVMLYSHVITCIIHCVSFSFPGWNVNAEERPTFTYLVGEFDKMCYEPQRYLYVLVSADQVACENCTVCNC